MDKQALIAKLKVIVKPYATNAEAYDKLDENTDFIKDLNINSANLVDIILDIEETFGVVINNEEMERMLDVKTAMAIVETKLAAQ